MARKAKKKAAAKKVTKKKASAAQRVSPMKARMMPGTKGLDGTAGVDAYIEGAPDYARPILEKLRSLFHKGCPDLEEKIKWGVPHFDYKGMMGGIAAFKNHVTFGFWKADQIRDTHNLFDRGPKASMCTVKITSLDDMPADKVIVSYVQQAVALNEAGIKKTKSKKATRKPLSVPADLDALLARNRKARETFDNFAPSHKREYIEWITEAKRDETRQSRLKTTIEWLNEGKPRNWKYMRK